MTIWELFGVTLAPFLIVSAISKSWDYVVILGVMTLACVAAEALIG